MGKLSDQQKLELVEKYKTGKYTGEALGKEYGIRGDSALAILKRRGVKLKSLSEAKRKYSLNEHFFDIVDAEEKAYFLGLLYADGYNNEKRGEIHLSLQEKDKDILEKLKLTMESSRPLLFLNLSKRYNKKQQDVYRFDISSRHMSNRLNNLGCHQAKSLTLEFPTQEQVPDNLIRHFVRGYFDGDGCFVASMTRKKYNQFSIGIVSTKNFCENLQKIVLEKTQVTSFLSVRHKERNNSTRNFNISGNLQVMKFLDWIYEDSKIYLNRKYQKYLKLKPKHF